MFSDFKYKTALNALIPALAAFGVYTCMFAFRKPFTAADYGALTFLGIDYKIWLVIAQTTGYTISKFYGIKFIAELKHKRRWLIIVQMITLAWAAWLFFGFVPAPYNILLLIINGFPLGMIYGIVFSYLEGRKSTEFLGAVLATSFIFAAGFTQSVGKYLMLEWGLSHWWMPFITGLIFFLPLLFFAWLLEQTPSPTKADIDHRTLRAPMNASERKAFIRSFLPGLILLVISYIFLTMLRDYRSNFASNIWNELGHGSDAAIFTQSEIPASLVVLVMMSLLVFVKNNLKALIINHIIIIAGFILSGVATILYTQGDVTPFWWITLTGVGLYMGYVPFNCMLFERLIAAFKYVSTAGFIIYVADSAGYIGSDAILIVKNFSSIDISWSQFFINSVLVISAIGVLLVLISAIYFFRKHGRQKADEGNVANI